MAVYKDKYPLKKGKKLPGEVRPSILAQRKKKKVSDKKTKSDKKKKDTTPPKKKPVKAKVPAKGRIPGAVGVLGTAARVGLYGAAAGVTALAGVKLLSQVFSYATRGGKPKQASKKLLASQKLLSKASEKKDAGFGVHGVDPEKWKSKKAKPLSPTLAAIHGGTIEDEPWVPLRIGVEEEEREKVKRTNIVVPPKGKKKVAKTVVVKEKKDKVESTPSPAPASSTPAYAQALHTKISRPAKKPGKLISATAASKRATSIMTKPRSEREGKADIVSQFIANLTGYRYTPGGGESAVPIKHYPKGERGPTGFTAYPPGWEPKKKKKKRNSSKSTMGYE